LTWFPFLPKSRIERGGELEISVVSSRLIGSFAKGSQLNLASRSVATFSSSVIVSSRERSRYRSDEIKWRKESGTRGLSFSFYCDSREKGAVEACEVSSCSWTTGTTSTSPSRLSEAGPTEENGEEGEKGGRRY